MALSVEEVRSIRFPMAGPGEDGYRASAVDTFLDRLVASYAALADENDRLTALATTSGGPVVDGPGERLTTVQARLAAAEAQIAELISANAALLGKLGRAGVI